MIGREKKNKTILQNIVEYISFQVVSELLLRVCPSTTNLPPTLTLSTPLLSPSLLHFAANTTTTYMLRVFDEDTIMGARVESILPLPNGVELSSLIITDYQSGIFVYCDI